MLGRIDLRAGEVALRVQLGGIHFDDGIASLRMALAARQSMEPGEVVRLETLPR